MNKWIPRIITFVYIAFLLLLSLDIFGEFQGLDALVGFLIHNIPTIILAGLLLFSWKKPRLGGQFFIVAGVVMTIFFKTYMEIISFLIVSFPVFCIGIGFMFARNKKINKH